METFTHNVQRSALGEHPRLFDTPGRFLIYWLWSSILEENDAIWCFPGSPFVFILRPVSDYWVLLFTSELELQHAGRWVRAKMIAERIKKGDFAGLLTIEGLKEEVIEIH